MWISPFDEIRAEFLMTTNQFILPLSAPALADAHPSLSFLNPFASSFATLPIVMQTSISS
jgi:hypothetical protein